MRLSLCHSAIAAALLAFAGPQAAHADAAPERLAIARADGSEISVWLEGRQASDKQGIFLVLQGSMCGSVAPAGNDRLDYQVPAGLVRMDIEKYALSPDNQGDDSTPCPEGYLQHNTVDLRVMDVLQTTAHLRRHAPWWNGRLYLMGVSEGATVAALAGPLLAETAGIVTINGSVGRPFRDGWADAMVASVAAQGGSDDAQRAVRQEAEDTWRRVRANPTPNEQVFGNGNTHLWWASIIDKQPVRLLLQSDAPILVLQADHDEMNPVEAGRSVAKAFADAGKQTLTYIELANLTHGLRTLDGEPGWLPVMQKVTDWVVQQESAR